VIIDSQVHLWLPNTPERPWPDDRPHGTQREVALEAEEMLALMDGTGVDGAVIVPPVWAGDDNRSAIDWCEQYPGRFGIMGRFDLWASDRERIESWLTQPGMLGIRMSYPLDRGDAWLRDVDEMAWFWSAAERLGIPLMIFTVGVAPIIPIAERYPDLVLIIDHLGLQFLRANQDTPVDPFAFIDDLVILGGFPNVYGKVSCMPSYSREPYAYADLRPGLESVFEAFGSHRLMWGSDITRLKNATYEQCLSHVASTLDFLSEDDRTWVLGETARSVLGWPG
jgi:L-fuconolactonase